MRYLIKQRLFAFGDDFSIKDDQGQDRFIVDGEAFSIGDKFSFQDMSGRELARIDQRVVSLKKTYEIYRGEELAAVVKKEWFTPLRGTFSIDISGPNDIRAEGNFWEHEYHFLRGAAVIAKVSKRYFALSDTYGVDIEPEQDDVLILSSVVVIDACCHSEED